MNKLMFIIGHKPRFFEKAGEGNGGGEDEAAKAAAKAAEEKAAADLKAAEEEVAKAKAEADKAKADAEKSNDPVVKQLSEEKAELLREVMDKKDKLKTAQKDLADTRKALEAYEGVDPAEVKRLLNEKKDAEKAALEAKGDFDRLKAMMAEEHAKEKQSLEEALEAERAKNKTYVSTIDELTVGNAFGTSEYIKDNLILSVSKARALYGSHFEMQDGQLVGFDKPAGAANRTMLINASGDPLSFDKAIEKIVEADPDKDSIKRSKMKQGASSSTSDKSKPNDDTKKKDGLFGRARIAASFEKEGL